MGYKYTETALKVDNCAIICIIVPVTFDTYKSKWLMGRGTGEKVTTKEILAICQSHFLTLTDRQQKKCK